MGSLQTVIFIHGFNSSEECWRNPHGSYWPELLKEEIDLAPIGIYIFSYRTSISSGYYSLGDVVDSLKEYLRLDKVLNHSRVVFVCHSMGGIVARRFLVNQQLNLLEGGLKEVGLFLVASPSLGSDYANMLGTVSRLVGHTQADALRFSQSNTWLNDLDTDFRNMKEAGKIKIKGKELIEDLPIILKGSLFFKKQIVEPFSGSRYFGDPFKVPSSDHFTIARPESASSIQHRLLCEFIKTVMGEKQESNYIDLLKKKPADVVDLVEDKLIETGSIVTYPTSEGAENERLTEMESLPSYLYHKCCDILLECDEFDDNRRLASMFVVQELYPFRNKLPVASSKMERVGLCIDFLMAQKVSGNPALIFFLQFLSERYHPEDMRHVKLSEIAAEVKTALTDSTKTKAPKPKTMVKDEAKQKGSSSKPTPINVNITILFLAADPTNASRLRLGEEFREIQEKLKDHELNNFPNWDGRVVPLR